VRSGAARAPHTTDVFSVLDRIPQETGRGRELILLSEGLHVNPELMCEREGLRPSAYQGLIWKQLGAVHRWTPAWVQAVEIRFVLRAPDANGRSAEGDDVRVLKDFYTAVTAGLIPRSRFAFFEGDC